MDFFRVCKKEARGKEGVVEVFPDFIVRKSKDLMVRAKSFYAIWDEERGLWSTDEYDVQRLVDEVIYKTADELKAQGTECSTKPLSSYSTGGWNQFQKFLKNVSDSYHQLDRNLAFANTQLKKTDYASKRLPYSLAQGDHSAWDEIVGTLYNEEERAKIEWGIGAVVSGDSKSIEKFLVFYGPPGAGKGTILKFIEKLFEGYVALFDAKALTTNGNSFATEAFKNGPLVAIQHDGDLSKIEDNTRLNSIVSHDPMLINEKFKPGYRTKIEAFAFMGTNTPVKITDAKSGIIRRLIDVNPSGNRIPPDRYEALVKRVDFELGAIAQHCLDVYRKMGRNYYINYQPISMMYQTDVFFNFVEAYYDVFKDCDGITLNRAYDLYKEYVEKAKLQHTSPQHIFREKLKSYFEEYHDRIMIDGKRERSFYRGFKPAMFSSPVGEDTPEIDALVLEETTSILDEMYGGLQAQYAKADGTPKLKWVDVKTVLSDLDTSKLHYLKVPGNHIVIDFDLKGEDGEKSLELNRIAASKWPHTYAEISKSGSGVHLHYIYDGDATQLGNKFEDGIEVKVYNGGSALRRKLTLCNSVPVATIRSGLPLKEKKMLQENQIMSEARLRRQIERNLNKEIHAGTKPSIDFIEHLLNEAYNSGVAYDVSNMRPAVIAFANNSEKNSSYCLKAVLRMKFASDGTKDIAATDAEMAEEIDTKAPLVFFDIEVFPNLLVVCWKYAGSSTVVRMINPEPKEIEKLLKCKLVGFNNRRYDNHILWARYMGYSIEQIYQLSKKIVEENLGSKVMFASAYGISYADIYEFSSKKQGLKKFQIELGLRHKEMDHPWDQPVPEEKIKEVVDYCVNDVHSTEAVFNARAQDFVARQILAELSGLSVNDTTAKHTAKIIFGNDRSAQEKFVYTLLEETFEGYKFDPYVKLDKSTYRGESVGEGGYVYAEPGIHENVALLDVESMHPTSIVALNLFGPYTENFGELLNARLAIKHADQAKARGDKKEFSKLIQSAREMLGGKLKPYLQNEDDFEKLSYALKIVINIVYGLTSATFDNPFRDKRNVDNIVAKRGALFMIDLKHFVQERGFTVAHIKTDSIKIPNATPEIIEEVKEFGRKYGYTFEHEATYKKMALVNDAVYIARVGWTSKKGDVDYWTATGAQFQHPYVFKSLFSGEPIKFSDICEAKSVTQGAMYLDYNPEGATPNEPLEGLHFIGKTGLFVPVTKESGGYPLLRVKDGKTYAVAGTKGYFWAEADVVKYKNDIDQETFDVNTAYSPMDGFVIDFSYFERLVTEAIKTIEEFGDYKDFAG